ncbi:MAG TPA: LysR family transcriptional regulator [Bacillota bacterium]|nr:LysR family transcriptional regulator [Bacillota bacterium]
MDSDDLRTFVELVRRGSFSAAASALKVSQPSVSRRVRHLEDELGVELFERTRPVVTPTRQGLAVLRLANRTLAEWNALVPALQGPEPLHGTLHIAASTTPSEYLLPGLLAEFTRLHPDIRFDMPVMNSDTVEACVRARHCDVGFLGRRCKDRHLGSREAYQDEVVLAVPAGHGLAGRESVDVAELAGEPFIVREPGSGTWAAVALALQAHGLELPPHRVVAQLASPHAVLEAVRVGHGVSFVSVLAARRESGVVTLRLRDLAILRPVIMIYDRRHVNRSAAAFLAFVEERLPLGDTP